MSTQKQYQCPRCGGTHLQKAAFRQYVGGAYSASPGGELYEDGPASELLVCMCGEPVAPPVRRSLTSEQRKSLEESLQKAWRHRRETELETIHLRLMEQFAGRRELEKTRELVATLQKVVQDIENGVTVHSGGSLSSMAIGAGR